MSYGSFGSGEVELRRLQEPLVSQTKDAEPQPESEPKQQGMLQRVGQWFGEWSLSLKIASTKVGNAILLNENQRFFCIPLDTAILNVLRSTTKGDLKELRRAAYTYCAAMKAFVNACGQGNIPDAQMQLTIRPDLKINGVTSKLPGERDFYTSLARACNQGSARTVSFLLDQKADARGIGHKPYNHPLLAACFSNSGRKLEVVSLLLDRRADPNMNLNGLNNPVIHILMNQHFNHRRPVHMLTGTVKMLIQNGAVVKGPIARPLVQSDFLTQSNLVDLSDEANDEVLTAQLVLAGGTGTARIPVPCAESFGHESTVVFKARFTSSLVQHAYEKAILFREYSPFPARVSSIIFSF